MLVSRTASSGWIGNSQNIRRRDVSVAKHTGTIGIGDDRMRSTYMNNMIISVCFGIEFPT